MGLKQQPKCKDKSCQFCTGKYCKILKQKSEGECPFRKERKSKAQKVFEMRSEIPLKFNEWRLIRDVFLTKLEKRRQFNEQCRRDLYRWFRENEPFVNDLAKDIAAASRTKFKIFRR